MAKKNKKVLIVEDEKPLSRALELKLTNAGFLTLVANDGQAALDILKKEKVDLILLDLVMPRVGGFEFLEKMKSSKNKAPVFVTSNLGQKEDIEKARKLGIKNYFVKSDVNINEIIAEAKKFLKVK